MKTTAGNSQQTGYARMRPTVTTMIITAAVMCALVTNANSAVPELITITELPDAAAALPAAKGAEVVAIESQHTAATTSAKQAARSVAVPQGAEDTPAASTSTDVTVRVGQSNTTLSPDLADTVAKAIADNAPDNVVEEIRQGQLGNAIAAATSEPAQPSQRVSGFVMEAISEDPTDPVAAHMTFKGLANSNGAHALPSKAARQLSAGQTAVIGYEGSSLGTSYDAKILMTATPSGEQLAAARIAGANTPHQVTVVMVLPPGGTPDGATPARLHSLITNEVAPFWKQQTGGMLDISVSTVHDWITLESDCAEDPFAVWSEAGQKINWQGTNTDHMLLYIPQNLRSSCGVGLGTIGTSTSGAYAWVSGPPRADVAAHEIGHNLGLGHANSLVCERVSDATYSKAAKMFSDGCVQQAYGDYSDVMGVSHGALGTLSQLNQHRLGVVEDSRRLVTTSGTTRLGAAHTNGGVKGMVIEGTSGQTYYIEYRTEAGENNWLRSRGIDEGLQVRKISPVSDRESLILDSTPTGNVRDRNVAITQGRSLVLDEVTVTLLPSSGTDYADVEVTFPGEELAAEEEPRNTAPPEPVGPLVKSSSVFTPAPPAEQSTNKVPNKYATSFSPQ